MSKIKDYLKQFKPHEVDSCENCPISKQNMRQLIGDKVNELDCYHRFSTIVGSYFLESSDKIEIANNYGVVIDKLGKAQIDRRHSTCFDMQSILNIKIEEARKTMETE